MNHRLKNILYGAPAAVGGILCATFPAFASNDNPLTGDLQGRLMPIVLAVLGVSLAVIIIIAVTSSKKKK